MTDPLSITVSVVALIGVAANVVEGLSLVKRFSNVAIEVLALENEVCVLGP